MTYKEYYQSNEDTQHLYNEVAILTSSREHFISQIDPTKWKWGEVKWCQDIINAEITFEDIIKICQFESKKINETSDCLVVLKMFHTIREKIEAITENESKAMYHQPEPKEIAASEAVGGFERFGTYPQTLSMVGVVAPSVKEVEAMDYKDVFGAMWYKHVEGQFQKQLYKK